jgi:Hypothetical protein (DUF2513)
MKRDMDMIRNLLLRIEALPSLEASTPGPQIYSLSTRDAPLRVSDEDPSDLHHHMRLLVNAGYLDLTPTQFEGSFNFKGLSWKGHDFLDSVRDEEVWRKTKQGALAAGGFTFELLADLAKGFVKEQIKLRTGIQL